MRLMSNKERICTGSVASSKVEMSGGLRSWSAISGQHSDVSIGGGVVRDDVGTCCSSLMSDNISPSSQTGKVLVRWELWMWSSSSKTCLDYPTLSFTFVYNVKMEPLLDPQVIHATPPLLILDIFIQEF